MLKRLLHGTLGPQSGNSLWLMSDKLLRMALGLLVGVMVARHLGPSGFGQLSLALTLLGFFAFSSTLGMDQIAVKQLVTATTDHDKADIFITILVMRSIGGVCGFLTLLTVVWLLAPWDPTTHLLASIVGIGLVFQAADVVDLWFQAKVTARYAVMAKSSAFIVASVWRIVLIMQDAPISLFAFATVIEAGISACLLGAVFIMRRELSATGHFNRSVARSLLTQSWPLIGSALAISIYWKADQFILAELLGIKAVGLYNAASRISEAWYFVPVSLVATAAPSIAIARAKSSEEATAITERLFRRLIWIGLAIALPMSIGAEWLISVLFGPSYASAATVLAIHIWAGIFVFLGVAQGPWFINEGLTHLALYRAVLGAIASIALNLALIPWLGMVGVAVSILIVQLLANVLLNAVFPAARPLFQAQMRALTLWRPISAQSLNHP